MSLSLATIGFTVTGIFFGIYAYTFYLLVIKKLRSSLESFSYAYFSLSLAFLIWGGATFMGDQNILNISVIIGNALLLLGTIFLLNLWFENNKSLRGITIIGCVILSLVFLWWRISYFYPQPTLLNGILLFNTQLPVAILLGLIFLLIWLPTSIKVGKIISRTLRIDSLSFIYSSIYVMATIAALIFIAARTIPMIVISFVGISLCFVMLLTSNIFIDKLIKK